MSVRWEGLGICSTRIAETSRRHFQADLTTECVFLPIEPALLAAGDVAAVLPRHGTFFVADRAVLGVEPVCALPRLISPSRRSLLMRWLSRSRRPFTSARRDGLLPRRDIRQLRGATDDRERKGGTADA
jgi:hypothetical protein